jgi:hypothetical protein
MRKIYIIAKNDQCPTVFDDYDQLIVFIRRNCFTLDDHRPVYSSIINDPDEYQDISSQVYSDAWNGFNHVKDTNYEYPDRERIKILDDFKDILNFGL